ncbi:hypothetical protein L9F63_017295, partial [Diploptera punctata]
MQLKVLRLSLPSTQLLFSFRNNSSSASTIYALSSGHGKCGVAVIRISGPKASEAIVRITRNSLPQPRHAMLRRLKDTVTNETLDKGLILWFPGPKSFTGEDSCEFQVHGGPAVVSAVLTALSKLPGFRPAEPGEFTKRAFHAGKLDLTEVEGLADLIHAETEAQRKQAFLQMEGNLRQLYDTWRQILIKSMAHVEAYIDFSEDENIEENVLETVEENIKNLRSNIQKHLADGRCGERLRDGVRTVIVGEPNVGKSSLLNLLCERPAAIVTPIAGTTRDVVEINMNIGGYPVIIADTAGLRFNTQDLVEQEGMTRARIHTENADLVIIVIDVTKYVKQHKNNNLSFISFIYNYIKELKLDTILLKFVVNKMDMLEEDWKHVKDDGRRCVPQLLDKLTDRLTKLCGKPSRELPCLTQARHRKHLTDCVMCLDEYLRICIDGGDSVLAAQQLRKALRQIGKITGHTSFGTMFSTISK